MSLDRCSNYIALSYSWDGQKFDRPLLLHHTSGGASRLLITKNSEDTLRRFRSDLRKNTSLRIWIDVISINQRDVAERNQQVSMMGDIYSKASAVWVWLGHETATSQKLFKALHLEVRKERLLSLLRAGFLRHRINRILAWYLEQTLGRCNTYFTVELRSR